MPKMILYGNKESGHSYKVRLALQLLGLDYEYRAVDIFAPRIGRAPDFQNASRFGEVPALVVDDDLRLSQSNAILLYLSSTSGRLTGGADEAHLAEWLFWEANRIGFSIPNLRYARRFELDTPAEITNWLELRAKADLERLEDEFSSGKPFLLGYEISVADISCCGYLFWPEQIGIPLRNWPRVCAWLERIAALPAWQHPDEMPS